MLHKNSINTVFNSEDAFAFSGLLPNTNTFAEQ